MSTPKNQFSSRRDGVQRKFWSFIISLAARLRPKRRPALPNAETVPQPGRSDAGSSVVAMRLAAVLGVITAAAWAAPQTIKPGEIWPDDRGRHIQAHGGGILKFGDTYYWFGEDRGQGLDRTNHYVGCYASMIFEDRPFGFRIARLSDDYLTVEKEMCLIPMPMEGGAVVRYQGLYYAIGSALTGWKANPNKYATAANLQGPWSEFKDLAPPAANTYGSQSTMMLKIVGTKATTVIFMGDIWKPQTQWDSRYLWMPLEIGAGKLWLPEPKEWTLDVETGEAVIKK
jgi:hypothetical protein